MKHPKGIYVAGCRCKGCAYIRWKKSKDERLAIVAAQMREYNRLHTPGPKRTA